MDALASLSGVQIRQHKEWGEILTGMETRNRYTVLDPAGGELYTAEEEGSGIMALLTRTMLKNLRPFTITIAAPDGREVLSVRRPFRFYFHQVDVYAADGMLIGTVRRRFSLLRRLYTVLNRAGQERFELFGPILHPWTFEIRQNGERVGEIVKKWSGLGKEMFTDADNFGIQFPADWPVGLKAVFLGATFLIDFVHFEDNNSSNT